jgi:hypothetical protein
VPRSASFPRVLVSALLACCVVHCAPAPQEPAPLPAAPSGAIVGSPDPALLKLLVVARLDAQHKAGAAAKQP